MPEFHGRDLRKGRRSVASQVYHVTTATRDRLPLFRNLYAARTLVQCMRALHDDKQVGSVAFVIMPDHVHWLFQLERSTLPNVMNLMKGRSSRALTLKSLADAPVWQKGFHDHAIRSDESLVSVSRYIVANPLRSGLVERIGDYPWWDAMWM